MLLMVAMLLTTSEVSSLGSNMSSLRLGKAKLLEDLRAHSAFKNKLSPCGDSNIVNISFSYRHYEVLMVEEVEQAVTSVGYIDITWIDVDLTWNKSDYGEVDVVSIPYNELWHPTIIVANAVEPDYLMIDKIETMTLHSDGIVNYVSPVYLKTTCNLDLRNYPFDTQKCEIVFMPFLDDVKYHITATSLGGIADQFSITGQWGMLSKSIDVEFVDLKHNVEIIIFTMQIKRRVMFYILCILSPMVLISSVTSMVFWIPPSSGEKISFLVTIFASNAILLNFIAGTMPQNMVRIPRIAAYIVLVNLQCMMAMIATIIVLRIYDKEQKDTADNQTNVPVEPTDKKVQTWSNEDDAEIESTRKPSKVSDRLTSRIVSKLSQLKQKVVPLEAVRAESCRRTLTRIRRCCLSSSTLDIIFFGVYHITSAPIYYILFIM